MDTLILRPDSTDSCEGGIKNHADGTPSYQYVDESTLNEADYNYLTVYSVSPNYILYGFPNHTTEAGTINKVTLKGYYKYIQKGTYSANTPDMRFAVKIGSTIYYSSTSATASSAALKTWEMTVKPSDSQAWTWDNIDALIAGSSLYGFGTSIKEQRLAADLMFWVEVESESVPEPPTNVAASENNSSKVVVTWTKSEGATGYKIYRDGNLIGTVGDVATYDDTGAKAPVITAGSTVASDGTSSAHVALSLSGTSIANGTTHSYTVKATNAVGDSDASSADNGYRLAGTLTYQWQRSSADADFDYEDIDGATTASYKDTDAP